MRAAEGASDPRLGAETWNLGLLSGGRAANVVPDLAEAELSLRTVPGGTLRAAMEAAKPPRGKIDILLDDTWDFFDTPPGFPSAPVPFGSDLPAMRALAPKAAAVLAGPGRASLAHTGIEELTREELSAGIALFRDLGPYYSRRYVMNRIPVTVLGATGVVGQRFVRHLAAHPAFELRYVAASERSVGKSYAEACDWRLPGEPYAGFGA